MALAEKKLLYMLWKCNFVAKWQWLSAFKVMFRIVDIVIDFSICIDKTDVSAIGPYKAEL